MIPARLLRQQLTIQRRGTVKDGYGNEVPADIGDPQTVGGFLNFEQSSENLNDRDTVTTSWVAYLNASAQVGPYDYLSFGGQTFEVSGQPHQVFNPRRGFVSHIEVRLVEVV